MAIKAEEIKQAVEFGRSAFAAKMPRRPAMDSAFMAFRGKTYPHTKEAWERSCALLKAWGKGWDGAEN